MSQRTKHINPIITSKAESPRPKIIKNRNTSGKAKRKSIKTSKGSREKSRLLFRHLRNQELERPEPPINDTHPKIKYMTGFTLRSRKRRNGPGMKAAAMEISPAMIPRILYFIVNTPFESAFSKVQLQMHFQRQCFYIASSRPAEHRRGKMQRKRERMAIREFFSAGKNRGLLRH